MSENEKPATECRFCRLEDHPHQTCEEADRCELMANPTKPATDEQLVQVDHLYEAWNNGKRPAGDLILLFWPSIRARLRDTEQNFLALENIQDSTAERLRDVVAAVREVIQHCPDENDARGWVRKRLAEALGVPHE